MNLLYKYLQHYILITLTSAFIAGLILQHFFPLPLRTAIGLSALLLIAALYCHRQVKSRSTLLFLSLGVSALGFAHAQNFAAGPLQENHIRTLINSETDVLLTGTLQYMPTFDGQKSTIIINSHSMRNKSDPYFNSTHGLVQLRMKGEFPKKILPGMELIIRSQLSRPYRFGTPGSFDYPAFLASRSIYTIGRIQSPAHIHVLEKNYSWLHTLRYLPERMRIRITRLIDKSVSPQHAGIYKALLIGDRSTVSPSTLEGFKASGCLHILAISGLHLSLLASTLFILCYWLARRSQYFMLHYSARKTALLATTPLLSAYALIAGSQTPVLRALIMVLAFILAFSCNRRHSPFTTLSLAALIILAINPLSLFTISFQLSFTAVASLILIFPQLTQFLKQKKDRENSVRTSILILLRWICAAFFVSIAATLGTAPLLIHAFHRFSTVGPLANILLEPLLCFWSLPLGLLAIALSFISPQTGVGLLHAGEYGIAAATTIANFFSSFSFSSLWFATPHCIIITFYYAALLFCLTSVSRKKTLPLFLAACCLFFFPIQQVTERYSSPTEITFLDVGQGSSTFIAMSGGKKILIDGGGSSSARFNVGEDIIAPYLWHRGIVKLDGILITHPDADHYNGIPFLLQRFRPEVLWTNGESGHNQEYDDLLTLADELNILTKTPDEKEVLFTSGEDHLIHITNPLQNNPYPLYQGTTGSNDNGLIVQFQGTDFSCLFPGDISRQLEHALLQNKASLQSTFLLSPHHGSKTSNSPEFLKAVSAKQIVVSAGRFRPQTFPSTQLQSYCRKYNIPLLNTAKEGTITISQHNNAITVRRFFLTGSREQKQSPL